MQLESILLCARRSRELHRTDHQSEKAMRGTGFRSPLAKTAAIVRKYKGSLSGEHGDGCLRESLSLHAGERNAQLCKSIKRGYTIR